VVMVTSIFSIRVASFLLLAVCGAVCQQRLDMMALSSLPDAPSAAASAQLGTGRIFAAEGRALFAASAEVTSRSGMGNIVRPARSEFAPVYQAASAQKTSHNLFDKYLYPALLKRNLNYHPSTSDSLKGRALYAASRIFVTRDETGKGRVNTSYFAGVLSAAALHMAYRPAWNRSASAPFSDFGSTIGNDAGMNLLHEFRPGLEQLMKSHTPKFVSKIEERVGGR
jgi:hypothetical protein